MKNKATIVLDINNQKKEYSYDILDSTRGPKSIDMRTFYKESGLFTYDVGFTSTASCSSSITYIDGEKGELRYRGYEIEKLVSNHSYLEVCYLLLNEKLPSKEQLKNFDIELRHRSFLHEGLKNIFSAFPDNAHPMATLSAGVTSLASFYFDHINIKDDLGYKEMAYRLIAKIPTVAAFSFRHSIGIPFIEPDINLSFTENFLFMLRAYPHHNLKVTKDGQEKIDPVEIKALDTIFSLHADHEQNASTTVVRTVASTGAHPYVAISAGINALWGRAHGGANESVIAQLQMIGSVDNVDKYIKKAKDPNDEFRLMGFGHRVYKNFDPRAKVLKKLQDELKQTIHLDSHLLDIATKIETIALNDEYFIKRNLYPNIDFYSGIILTALRIPKQMFTAIFVIGRTVGWITQYIEFKKDKQSKIARPRQIYKGK
ncbi:MAG: citrate (Si)-synthase [Campylobacteraceae bacterium 4484_166]|nr:MAG: citrate (Si)-synthase [Campylobacteraceae bacterium 4484_166]